MAIELVKEACGKEEDRFKLVFESANMNELMGPTVKKLALEKAAELAPNRYGLDRVTNPYPANIDEGVPKDSKMFRICVYVLAAP
jgi:hypothetical protein